MRQLPSPASGSPSAAAPPPAADHGAASCDDGDGGGAALAAQFESLGLFRMLVDPPAAVTASTSSGLGSSSSRKEESAQSCQPEPLSFAFGGAPGASSFTPGGRRKEEGTAAGNVMMMLLASSLWAENEGSKNDQNPFLVGRPSSSSASSPPSSTPPPRLDTLCDLMELCRHKNNRANNGADGCLWPSTGEVVSGGGGGGRRDDHSAAAVVVPGNRNMKELADIPISFPSPDAYLRTMQAHTDAEFGAQVRQSMESFDNATTATKGGGGGGWREWRLLKNESELTLAIEGCDGEWLEEPWVLHAIQLEGVRRPCLCVMSGTAESICPPCPPDIRSKLMDNEGYLVLRGCLMLGSEGRLRSLGFVGSHVLEYESAQLLRTELLNGTMDAHQLSLLRQVADPSSKPTSPRRQWTTLLPPCAVDDYHGSVNASQRQAIRSVNEGLSIIHGPPATGKSTTILHLLQSRTRPGSRVLITCTRNQAINAVAEKLAEAGSRDNDILAFGNERSLREVAKRYTLKQRILRDPCVVFFTEAVREWDFHLQASSSSSSHHHLRHATLQSLATSWHEDALRYVSKEGDLYEEAGLWNRVLELLYNFKNVPQGCNARDWLRERVDDLARFKSEVTSAARRRIVRGAKIFLCTIDSTPRLMNDLSGGDFGDEEEEEDSTTAATTTTTSPQKAGGTTSTAGSKRVASSTCFSTVIVDEAGCVLESAIPILIRWAPSNIILIGDHLQLSPFTAFNTAAEQCTHLDGLFLRGGHIRSLMQRAVEAGCDAPMLDTQYRMHPIICRPISRLFYHGKLRSGEFMDRKRSTYGFHDRREGGPARWVDCQAPETAVEGGGGYYNEKEAALVVEMLERIRRFLSKRTVHHAATDGDDDDDHHHHQNHVVSVFIITFYNAQKRAIESYLRDRYGGSEAGPGGSTWRFGGAGGGGGGGDAVVTVLTVDSVQGSEADVVILSTVRSHSRKKDLGSFMKDPRRVCVALSRAKELSLVVGNASELKKKGGKAWATVVQTYTAMEDGYGGSASLSPT